MRKFDVVALSCSTVLFSISSINAATIFNNTYTWIDPISSGEIQITVDVFDDFGGDLTRNEWRYTVDNISYNPQPGLTTGFSGLHLVFALPGVPGISDQYGPAGWVFNQDHEGLGLYLPVPAVPPAGIGWDTANPLSPGIMPGFSGEFGFTTSDQVSIGMFGPGLNVAHSYDVNGDTIGLFTGNVATPYVPIPAAIWLFSSGLLGLVGIARRKKV